MLTSCIEGESKKSVVVVEEANTEIFSDVLNQNELEDVSIQNYELLPYEENIVLLEKVFDVKTDLSPESCETFIDGCDCCSGKIVFIDEYIFIEEFYCIPNDNFYIGYYNVFDDNIKLYYETKFVSYGPEDEMNFKGENVYKVHQFQNNKSITIELSAYNCNGNLIIKSEDSYYSENETITTAELLEQYSMNEFWDILNVNEIIENFYNKK